MREKSNSFSSNSGPEATKLNSELKKASVSISSYSMNKFSGSQNINDKTFSSSNLSLKSCSISKDFNTKSISSYNVKSINTFNVQDMRNVLPNLIMDTRVEFDDKKDECIGAKEMSSINEIKENSAVQQNNLSLEKSDSHSFINASVVENDNSGTGNGADKVATSEYKLIGSCCVTAKNLRTGVNVKRLELNKMNEIDENHDADDEEEIETDGSGGKENSDCSHKLIDSVQSNTAGDSVEKSIVDTCDKLSDLKVTIDNSGLASVTKSIRSLYVTTSDESSEESDEEPCTGKADLRKRGPIHCWTSKSEQLKKTHSPYHASPTQHLKTALADLGSSQFTKESSEDLSSISIPDAERKFFKALPAEVVEKLIKDLDIEFMRQNGSSSVQSENPQSTFPSYKKSDGYSQYGFNIPPNPSSDSCSATDYTLSNFSSEIFDEMLHRSQSSLSSPDYEDSVFLDNGTTSNRKKSSEDELCTSDYGSPSGTNEMSPTSSISPNHALDLDGKLNSLGKSAAYVGTFDYGSSYNRRSESNLQFVMNPNPTDENKGSATNGLKNDHRVGVANIVPSIVHQQQPNLQPSSVNYYALPYAQPMWGCLPSVNSNMQPGFGVVIPTHVENGQMLIHSAISYPVVQSVSHVPVIVSGGVNNYQGSDVNSENQNKYVKIKSSPGSLQVYETDMLKRGFDRLVDMCKSDKRKKRLLVIQWVTVLVETGRLEEHNQSMILIKLLKQLSCHFGDNPMTEDAKNLIVVWAERFLATILCINKMLQKPEIFITSDSEGNTPLSIAAFENYNKPLIARVIADCIAKNDLNPSIIDRDGNSILHLLIQRGSQYEFVLAELLNVKKNNGEPKFDVNCKNIFGMTPLHVAVNPMYRSLPLVKLLMRHGARVDVVDNHNSTPLHTALIDDYNTDILRTLLVSPCCRQIINIENFDKDTPIMIAAKTPVAIRKQEYALRLLQISGANIKQVKSVVNTISDPARRELIKNLLQTKRQ